MQNVIIKYKGVILLFLAFVFLANSVCSSFKVTQESNSEQVNYYEK